MGKGGSPVHRVVAKLYCKTSGMIDDTISKLHGLKGALMKTLVLLLVVAGLAASPAAAQKERQTGH